MMRYKNPSEHVVLLKTVLKARRNTPTTKANTIELMSEFVPWRLHHYPKELLLE